MAINLYLAKKHGKGLWRNSPESEAQAIQWSVWVMAEVEKAALAVLLNRYFLPEDQRNPKVAADGEQQLQRPLKVLDEALANTGYLVGTSFTVTDLNVASVLSWAKKGHVDLSAYPRVDKWLTEALRRPAAMKASGRT
jgi:glutathione S-transferase